MAKFRKKPVVIDAFQWTGGPDQTEDPEWIVDAIRDGRVSFRSNDFEDEPRKVMAVETIEGTMIANPGDYIIRGVEGEIYPCKPSIFEQTYEKVD